MKTIYRVGIVGTGMMGRLQTEALRRIPGIEITAAAGNTLEHTQKFCAELFIPHAYDSYETMLEQENLDVIHICTPNYSHFPICKAALLKGLHVYCEKPLANTAKETEELCRIAKTQQVAAGVNFNYRHNAIIQDMHERISGPDWGKTFLIHGHYIQDWMMYDEDYNWRCIPELGGNSRTIADIGSHWFDTVQFITGKKITRVFAKLITVIENRKKFSTQAASFEKQSGDNYELVKINSEDAAFILVQLEDGTLGNLTVSQVSGGYKNRFVINVDGSHYSMSWNQESADQLLIGHRENGTTLIRSAPDTLHGAAVSYATLPGGHAVAWNDALKNAIQQFYSYLRNGGEKHFASFEDGHYIVKLVEACLESNRIQGWVDVI